MLFFSFVFLSVIIELIEGLFHVNNHSKLPAKSAAYIAVFISHTALIFTGISLLILIPKFIYIIGYIIHSFDKVDKLIINNQTRYKTILSFVIASTASLIFYHSILQVVFGIYNYSRGLKILSQLFPSLIQAVENLFFIICLELSFRIKHISKILRNSREINNYNYLNENKVKKLRLAFLILSQVHGKLQSSL